MKRYLYYFLLPLLGLMAYASVAFAGSGTVQDPFHVYMVLWRGETKVEEGFKDYFRDRGIAVRTTIRNLDRDPSKAEEFIAEARELRPDLIYTWGTSGTLAMRGRFDAKNRSKFITDIPGVFTLVAYPINAGIVPDYQATRRNLTGVLFLAPVEAQIGLINAYLSPQSNLQKLAAIYNPQEKNSRINIDFLTEYATAAGIDLQVEAMPIIEVTEEGRTFEKPDSSAIPKLFKKIRDNGNQFIYIGADSYMTRRIKEVSQASLEYKMPVFVATEAPIIADGSLALLSLTTPYYNLGQLTAYQAEEILAKGYLPQQVPVRSLSEFNILLNGNAMKSLHYFPPIELLLDAKFVNVKE